MNAAPFVFALALVVPVAGGVRAQPPATAAEDWGKDVERAANSPRFGLRLAASRKLAAAGAAAVPAIRAFGRQHTFDTAMLIDAVADADSVEAPVLELLREWATQRDFYWRGAAMRGLARRADRMPHDGDALAKWFASYHGDVSWLMRAYSRLGSLRLGDDAVFAQPEPDPRATVRLAALALGADKVPPLQPLLDALLDERTFLGDPWGRRTGDEARRALKAWLGDAWPVAADDPAAPAAAMGPLLAAARTKSGQDLRAPMPRTDAAPAPTTGIAVFSCRNGDLFVSWSRDGTLRFGLDGAQQVPLPAPVWDALSKQRAALSLDKGQGVVICDNLQLCWTDPDVNLRVAPGMLPPNAAEWLKRLAQAIEEASAPSLAGELRSRFEQFASR